MQGQTAVSIVQVLVVSPLDQFKTQISNALQQVLEAWPAKHKGPPRLFVEL